jgi:hypothetical protein
MDFLALDINTFLAIAVCISCFFSSFSAIAASDPALTSLARYLIHDSSEYVTGNNFIVDCGATLPGVPIYSSL